MYLPRPRSLLGLTLLLVAACHGGDGGTTDPDAAPPACTFGAALTGRLPHVHATGAQAQQVVHVLEEILAAQQPPLPTDRHQYALPAVSCLIGSGGPVTPKGTSCLLTLTTGDTTTEVRVESSSPLAQELYDAIAAAGAVECQDPAHGEFLRLQAVQVDGNSNDVQFDDHSNYALPPTPNVVVEGAAADAVLTVARDADIDDCTDSSKLFLVCNGLGQAPVCSYVRHRLHDVAGSALVNICLPEPVDDPIQLSAEQAAAMWDAILAAARSSGYVPEDGPLEKTNVINASYFAWDGHRLSFQLVTGTATPPPPPPTLDQPRPPQGRE